jgi:Domain of unknown function (DUF4112)
LESKAARQQRSLDGLRRWARLFDAQFRVPGTQIRFGIDPLIGLVPGIGDMASPLLTIAMLWHALRLRVPRVVLARMVLNALIDAGVGAVPIVGDLFDFAWRASEWNMALLERHAMPGREATSGDYLFVIVCVLVVFMAAAIPIVTAWAAVMWLRALVGAH